MEIKIELVDYSNQEQGKDLLNLLDCYARDPMGGGEPLAQYVKENLLNELSKLPHAFSLICYVDGVAAGLVNCFDGFSSFTCKPLVNIHDLIVANDFRGLGIGQQLLQKVEEIAVEKGCGKLTLEVLEGNAIAQATYTKFGFSGYELDPQAGRALFWDKKLNTLNK